jgi:hypothetical protein
LASPLKQSADRSKRLAWLDKKPRTRTCKFSRFDRSSGAKKNPLISFKRKSPKTSAAFLNSFLKTKRYKESIPYD